MAATEQQHNTDAAPPKSTNRLMVAGLFMNTLLVLVLIALQFLKESPPAAAAQPAVATEGGKEPAAARRGPTLPLGEYVVRLRNPDAGRYARFNFEVLLDAAEDVERVKSYLPEIRDSFILFLSGRALEELQGTDQLETTKAELLRRVDQIVPGRSVRALYLTEFVLQ